VNEFAFRKVAGLDPVVNEGLAETSVSHDELQVNKGVWL